MFTKIIFTVLLIAASAKISQADQDIIQTIKDQIDNAANSLPTQISTMGLGFLQQIKDNGANLDAPASVINACIEGQRANAMQIEADAKASIDALTDTLNAKVQALQAEVDATTQSILQSAAGGRAALEKCSGTTGTVLAECMADAGRIVAQIIIDRTQDVNNHKQQAAQLLNEIVSDIQTTSQTILQAAYVRGPPVVAAAVQCIKNNINQ